jgi:lipoic acid synthetase
MLQVRRLGVVPYEEALSLQHAIVEHAQDNYLLVLEHPHVYTLGVRTDPAHLLVAPASVGAQLFQSDRGGDVTYHGPGQLVCYPLVTVGDDPGVGPLHVKAIEKILIESLRELGVRSVDTFEGYPGVWLFDGEVPKKVAAIGVKTTKVSDGRRRTLHGIACNVTSDLSMFSHIVPCGISEYPVTSLQNEGYEISVTALADTLIKNAAKIWGKEGVVEHAATPPPKSDANEAVAGEPVSFRRLRRAGVEVSDALPIAERKPEWLRVPVSMDMGYRETHATIKDLGLVTVCEEAGCPNIFECWSDHTATFMVNGERCTRACGFCLVDTRHPLPLDPTEPKRVAQAVKRLGLHHVVITCVARDDLQDGGAGAIAQSVSEIRELSPDTKVEVLISDLKGDLKALDKILSIRPDVVNHNLETVLRLQRAVRPSASYARSLGVLARVADAGLVTKSGIMVGLGEEKDELKSALLDLAAVGVQIATIGQYLRPSKNHLPVSRFYTPEEFDELKEIGLRFGLTHVESSPLTRSSYHAKDAANALSTPVSISSR